MEAGSPGEATSGLIVLPRADTPLVSIIIPSTNQAERLSRCLTSLVKHIGPGVPYEVILVLNAASDEVKRVVREQVRGVKVVESEVNLGVAGGYNRGRSLARGDYLLVTHDDTEAEPQWLESLLETARANPGAGAIGSTVLHMDGGLQSTGAVLWREGLTSHLSGPWDEELRPLSAVTPVDYSGTCSLLVRADIWDAIGGMEERLYPAYYVDVDVCMAVRSHGGIVLCDPHSRIRHHRGASSGRAFKDFVWSRNREFFTAKWAAELESYEPYDPANPEALARARARTCRLATELTSAAAVPVIKQGRALDTAAQDVRHRRLERELQRDFAQFLERQLSEASEKIGLLRTKLAQKNTKLTKQAEKIQSLQLEMKRRKAQRKTRWHEAAVRGIKRLLGRP